MSIDDIYASYQDEQEEQAVRDDWQYLIRTAPEVAYIEWFNMFVMPLKPKREIITPD